MLICVVTLYFLLMNVSFSLFIALLVFAIMNILGIYIEGFLKGTYLGIDLLCQYVNVYLHKVVPSCFPKVVVIIYTPTVYCVIVPYPHLH